MARNSKRRVSISEETVHGTTNSNPTQLVLEHDDQTFAPNISVAQSGIIRTDARVKESTPLNRSAGGGITSELVYPTVNEGLWSAIRAALNTAETAQFSEALSGALNGITIGGTTIARSAGDFTTNWKVGDIGKVTNASDPRDNRYFMVTTVVALTLTVQLVAFTGLGTTWAATDTDITITRGARMIDNTSTTERAFTVEIAWLELQQMCVYTGHKVGGYRIDMAMGRPTTIAIEFVGRDGVGSAMSSATVGISGATYTQPTELPVFGPAKSIFVAINGVAYPVSSLSLGFNRSLRVGHSTEGGATPDRVSAGLFTATISLSCYYAAATLITQGTAGTTVPVWLVMEDGAGKALSWSMGSIVWGQVGVGSGGPNSDAMVTVSGAATNNSTRDACVTQERFQ